LEHLVVKAFTCIHICVTAKNVDNCVINHRYHISKDIDCSCDMILKHIEESNNCTVAQKFAIVKVSAGRC
jgi:hypothetical protein